MDGWMDGRMERQTIRHTDRQIESRQTENLYQFSDTVRFNVLTLN